MHSFLMLAHRGFGMPNIKAYLLAVSNDELNQIFYLWL